MEEIDLCAKLIIISESVSFVGIGYKVSMCAVDHQVYHLAKIKSQLWYFILNYKLMLLCAKINKLIWLT